MIINGRAWKELPEDLQKILSSSFNEAIVKERADVRALNDSTMAELKAKGMTFNSAKPETFRAALKQSGFYEEWRKKFGDAAEACREVHEVSLPEVLPKDQVRPAYTVTLTLVNTYATRETQESTSRVRELKRFSRNWGIVSTPDL